MGMGTLSGNDCCSSEQTEQSCDLDNAIDQEDDSCCDGPSCDCMCCGHVFLSHALWSLALDKIEINTQGTFTYSGTHTAESQGNIWQPPKNLQ